MRVEDEPFVDPLELARANQAHDFTPHDVCFDFHARLPSSWKEQFVGGLLTDKKINRYEAKGFYSIEFKQKRMEYAARKKGRKRMGNFIEAENGRFIYSPL